MEFKIKNTQYPNDFTKKVEKAKGVSVTIFPKIQTVDIQCAINGKVIADFSFSNEKNSYVLVDNKVYDDEFNPLEITVFNLIEHLKDTKVKSIKI